MSTSHIYNKGSEKGISLIELAIAVVVISVLLVPFLQMYRISMIKKQHERNFSEMEKVAEALSKYAQLNNHLPMPALPTETIANANYGKSITDDATGCAAYRGTKGLVCVGGAGVNTPPVSDVVFGMLPFRELGLSENDAYDDYGSKLTYVVTRGSTNSNTFNNEGGTIAFVNQNGASLDGGPGKNTFQSGHGTVIFALISHGPNRRGAYQRDGSLEPCPPVADLDTDNCNRSAADPGVMDASLRGMQQRDPNDANILLPILSQAVMMGAGGVGFYDDTIDYRTSVFDSMWSSANTANNTQNGISANMFRSDLGKTFIGANAAAITPDSALDIEGNVKAAKAMTESICDGTSASDSDCFRVKNITAPRTADTSAGPDKAVVCPKRDASNPSDDRMDGFKSIGIGSTSETDRNSRGQKYAVANCETAVPAPIVTQSTFCPYGISGWGPTGPKCVAPP